MSPKVDRRLAKDVAKQIERRRARRRITFWLLVLAAVVAAALYLRCGRGWGLGGTGKGEGEGPGAGTGSVAAVPADAAPPRCQIRVSSEGIAVDGKLASRDDAVATCKLTAGADVVVTGDARQGDWEELQTALDHAGIPTFLRK